MAEQERIPSGHQELPTSTSAPDPEKQDDISTARLLRRVDIRLVPILSALYLLCFLCRQNIGNAKTYHMSMDLPLTTQEYQLALTAFFLAYSTFDIPSNILLKKLRPSVWLPLVTLLSGVVTTCMGVVKNADELIVVRLVLGMTEVSSIQIWSTNLVRADGILIVWAISRCCLCDHYVVLQKGSTISTSTVLLCCKVGHLYPSSLTCLLTPPKYGGSFCWSPCGWP